MEGFKSRACNAFQVLLLVSCALEGLASSSHWPQVSWLAASARAVVLRKCTNSCIREQSVVPPSFLSLSLTPSLQPSW